MTVIVRATLFSGLLSMPAAYAQAHSYSFEIVIDQSGSIIWNDVPLSGDVELEAKLLELSKVTLRPSMRVIPSNNLKASYPAIIRLTKTLKRYGFDLRSIVISWPG
jgi:biopolymer transport protein ExbD